MLERKKKYGGITKLAELKENLRAHCIADGIFEGLGNSYDNFLDERRRLMAAKLSFYFGKL